MEAVDLKRVAPHGWGCSRHIFSEENAFGSDEAMDRAIGSEISFWNFARDSQRVGKFQHVLRLHLGPLDMASVGRAVHLLQRCDNIRELSVEVLDGEVLGAIGNISSGIEVLNLALPDVIVHEIDGWRSIRTLTTLGSCSTYLLDYFGSLENLEDITFGYHCYDTSYTVRDTLFDEVSEGFVSKIKTFIVRDSGDPTGLFVEGARHDFFRPKVVKDLVDRILFDDPFLAAHVEWADLCKLDSVEVFEADEINARKIYEHGTAPPNLRHLHAHHLRLGATKREKLHLIEQLFGKPSLTLRIDTIHNLGCGDQGQHEEDAHRALWAEEKKTWDQIVGRDIRVCDGFCDDRWAARIEAKAAGCFW
ncbi:hypothetical protein DFJ74DRAFT_529730 [Hyaloraphidium curvatum]|nr:hypothetical protein DFJ74DRAFT_529730 [Hyaloraphidium curvatum]